MYDTDGKLVDRREMLRVKVKSLAEEARIIRREEGRTRGQLRDELHLHRVGVLRSAARDAHVAYGLVRGRALKQIEPTAKSTPRWSEIRKMLKKYGPAGLEEPQEMRAALDPVKAPPPPAAGSGGLLQRLTG